MLRVLLQLTTIPYPLDLECRRSYHYSLPFFSHPLPPLYSLVSNLPKSCPARVFYKAFDILFPDTIHTTLSRTSVSCPTITLPPSTFYGQSFYRIK